MSKWKEYKFSDFIDINPIVKIPKGVPISFVEMKDLDSVTKYCTYSQMKELGGGSRFKDGDTLFARITPCLENGKICKVRGLKNGYGFGSTEFYVFRGKDGVSDSDFVYYLSRSEDVRSHAEHNLEGSSGRQRVPKEAFENLVLKLPPLDEQKRIAGVLSSLDDKIDLLHRENATLEALAETLFRHYFIENPNPTWKEGKLGDVCHYVTDKMETSSLTTISYISTENMLNDKQGVTEASSIPNDIRVTRYGVGDILLSNIRPYFKKIWLADRRGGCSNDVLCIRANEKEFDCFVYYTLRQDDFFDYVMLGSKGCKMPRGDKQHIMNWPICLPNVESLGVFNKPVYLMIQKIESNQQQILTLTTQRDMLLPRLISGEVKVGE